jgi:nucleotide-binding universal stress UspA family protein
MRKVLLPIDGSECALRAVALVIAKRALHSRPDDIDVHLVNVQTPLPHGFNHLASHDQIAALHREESEKLMRDACKLLDAVEARYSCHQLVGKTAETIISLADSLHCDQIVMGAQGRGALKDGPPGSVALKTVHLSKIPVLLVK